VNVGELVKKIRVEENVTQEELSERMGISRSYLSDVENNRKNPSVVTLEKLAKALNKQLKIEIE